MIEQKLSQASEALSSASAFLEEMKAELTKKKEQVEATKATYEHSQQLANTEEAKAKAFIEEMARVVRKSTKAERWWGFSINVIAGLLFLILGVVLSDWLRQKWVSLYNLVLGK